MPNLSVIPLGWSGPPVVGPGVSVMHCQAGEEDAFLVNLRAFVTAIQDQFPEGLQWTFPTAGVVLDEATGVVNNAWSSTSGGAPIAASGFGTWSNGVGARVRWPTIGVVNGRTVVGSTFFVPLKIQAYEGAGNITSSVLTVLQNASSTFAAAPSGLRIYSRKTPKHAGISFPVLGAAVPDRVSWLRGRRT